jgi:hypothetical protein
MFAGQLGIRLVLWLGKTVPAPPLPGVVEALLRTEVTNDASTGDGFQLTFALGKNGADWDLLRAGGLEPGTRVVLGIIMGASPEVLMDGVITHHELAPSNDPGQSTLTVTGRDLTTVMDLEERNEKYENQPDFVIFSRLIGNYAQYGLVPMPTPTSDVPIMLQRIPRQAETDLKFIERMARRNGYVFYVEPLTFGVNRAYFGPPIRAGLPQPALSMNMGDATNVTALTFRNDALAPVAARGSFVEPFTKLAIPIPQLPSLRVPPLAASAAPALRTTLLRESAKQSPIQAALSGLSASMSSPDAVRGDGEVDALRYGAVLRARRLVGVRGAGLSYNGFYWVERVSHRIQSGQYTQSFSLSREGTGALTPVVVP